MTKTTEKSDLLLWASEQPELMNQLARLRQLEDSETAFDFDRAELEMLELSKSIGASSLARCIQAREPKVVEEGKSTGGGRIHGKKN